MTTSRSGLYAVVLALVVFGLIPLVHAHSGAMGVVKERMDLMKGMGDAMKTIGAMLKGETPFEPAMIAEKAGYLAEHAGQISKLTPEGSNDKPSEALPIIWQEWDGYEQGVDLLAQEGAKLATIAGNGADERAIGIQFAKVSNACGSCHDKYRKPKDDRQR